MSKEFCYHNGKYTLDKNDKCCKCRLPLKKGIKGIRIPLKPREDEDVSIRKIVRCEDPMVCLRGCSVHEQTCKNPIYGNKLKPKEDE